MATNLTPQEQQLRAAILQRWGNTGQWNNDSVDLAGDLARRMVASGITDLSKLQFTPTKRREQVSAEYQGADEYRPAQFADYDNAFDLTYDGKAIGSKGFLGDINRDGSLGDGNVFASNTYHPNLLAWNSGGKGAHNYEVAFDEKGNPIVKPVFQSSSYWNSDLGGLTKAAAMSVGAYFGAGALNGAGTGGLSGLDAAMIDAGAGATNVGAGTVGATAGGTAGMSGSELAAFLEANAGALAPGGEVAAGYGTTWGVGADGIIGAGATMAANGVPLNPSAPPANPSTPRTPGSPPGNSSSPPPGTKTPGPEWTLKDTLRVADAAVKVAGSASGGGGGGGGSGDPDQRLIDAQLKSMDLQDQMLTRMISNADMIMPFQKEALDFSMRTAKEGYQDYRDDRTYALGRRGKLTELQDQAIADAQGFNTEAKRRELAGQAIADVNRAYSDTMGQTQRMMTRSGRSLNDGRWGSVLRQMVADKTLAQAAAGTNADRAARMEGRMLTDRAAGYLSGSPQLAMAATGRAQGAGASTVPLAGQSLQSMNSGLQSVGNLAGQMGNNATSMYGQQMRGGGGGGTDWSAAGALLGGLTKAYEIWGK